MTLKLSKVNKRYDMADGKSCLYVQIIVPTERASDLRQKLNNLIDWFMSKNKIKGLNKLVYDMSIPKDIPNHIDEETASD